MARVIDLSWTTPPPLVGLPHLMDDLVADVAEALRGTLVRLAQERLLTSSAAYVEGLLPVEYIDGGAIIALEGWLANAVEEGADPWDLKQQLLKGRTVREGKNGPYAIVPFRHGSPTSRGTSFQRVGAAYGASKGGPLTDEAASALGKKIWSASTKAAKRKAGGEGSGRVAGGLAGKLKAHHRTDIFEGMQKQAGNERMTFRTVSARNDASAWMHPGIEGRHLFRDAEAEIPATAKAFLERALKSLGPGGG